MVTSLHPTPRTWTDGNADLTAALLNQELADQFNFLQQVPYCRVGITAPPTITTATDTVVAWTKEYEDADSMHDNVTNNPRITVPVAGVYRVRVHIDWASNSVGFRDMKIKKNGTTFMMNVTSGLITNDYRIDLYHDVRLAATDYLEVVVYQTSGGNLAISADGDSPEFSVRWVRV